MPLLWRRYRLLVGVETTVGLEPTLSYFADRRRRRHWLCGHKAEGEGFEPPMPGSEPGRLPISVTLNVRHWGAGSNHHTTVNSRLLYRLSYLSIKKELTAGVAPTTSSLQERRSAV